MHPTYGVQDWDDPPHAIAWPRFASFLQSVRATGTIPPDHRSHDHMNIQREVSFSSDAIEQWRARFAALQDDANRRRRVKWVLVDGFLLYWNQVRPSKLRIYLSEDGADMIYGERH